MHFQHIGEVILVIIVYQLLSLTLSFLLLKGVWAYSITEINFGSDRLIVFSVKNIKINIGFSFLLGGSLQIAVDENGQISDKQNKALAYCGIIVNTLLLGSALILSGQKIDALLKFICYYFFLFDSRHLRFLLHHFNSFDLFVGLTELGLIWVLLNKLIISLPTTVRTKNNLYITAIACGAICYVHLILGYIIL